MALLLSILIPAYNEASTIVEVVRRVQSVDTSSVGFDQEIIVCDDRSSDATRARVAALATTDPRVRVVRHHRNQGKGAAIRTALAAARGDYCLIQDADLEYDPDDYPAMLSEVVRGAEVVYGSRFLANARPTGMRASHLAANRLLTLTANTLYDLSITDEATCLKLFRTELLRGLDLSCTGFEFCSEVTAKLGRRGIRIAEVPIAYSARTQKQGKKVRWSDGVEAMWVLIKHRLNVD